MKVRKAVIPVAGMGTRLLPATKAIPKEMMPILDKPTIQFIVEEAVESGIEEILVVTSRGKRAIEDHFDHALELEIHLQQKQKFALLDKVQIPSQLVNMYYIRQKEPKGLGHAISCARPFVGNEPFAVLLGDTFFSAQTPCLKQIIDVFHQVQQSVIGVLPVSLQSTDRYGIVDATRCAVQFAGHFTDKLHRIHQLVEKPKPEHAPSNLAMIGRYVLTPAIFELLASLEPGVSQEIQLTDAIAKLNALEMLYAYEVEGTWHDVGDPFGYLHTMLLLSLQNDELKSKVIDLIHQIGCKD